MQLKSLGFMVMILTNFVALPGDKTTGVLLACERRVFFRFRLSILGLSILLGMGLRDYPTKNRGVPNPQWLFFLIIYRAYTCLYYPMDWGFSEYGKSYEPTSRSLKGQQRVLNTAYLV